MIKTVGGTEIKPIHRASCHCGAVVLELALLRALRHPYAPPEKNGAPY